MGSKQITFKEGASLNRTSLFEGEHFSFWKKRMEILIQSIDPGAWNAIIKGPFIPTKELNGELIPKEWNEMRDDEKRKVQDYQKAKYILTSSLSFDELFRTATCKSEKEIWNMLEVIREGTMDVRRARNLKHALKVVSKAILNLSVLSTLENMVVKRKGRRTENKRKPT